MKKNLSLIAAISLMALSINAQTTEPDFREQLRLGVKVGVNYSNVYDSQGEQFNADPKFGLAAGGFLAIPVGKYLGVQPELLFSQKGFKATGVAVGIPYELTRTTNFIDIPILFVIKPSTTFSILAGPQYSYLIKQKNVFTNPIASVEQEEEFQNENIRKNILCFLGGIDINLDQMVLGLRAGWDIQNNNGDGTSTTPRYKNVWYQATAGFRF